MNKKAQRLSVLMAAGIVLPAVYAADATWYDAGTGIWNLSAMNWNAGATTWTDGDTAVFSGSGGNVTVSEAVAAAGLTFSANGYTVGGTGPINTSTSTIAAHVADNKSAIVAVPIAGTGKLEKSGGGSLTVTGVNTYTGGTLVGAGKVILANKNLKALSTGTITVSPGAALDVFGCGEGAPNAALAFPTIYAGGAGPDGRGALLNTGAPHGNARFAALYLTDDLVVNVTKRINFNTVYAQGHTFRLNTIGGEQMAIATFDNSQGGDISIEAGTYTAWETANALGNTPSKGKVYMRGGMLNVWDGITFKNDIVVESASYIQEGKPGTQATFGGTITINAPISFYGDAVVPNGTLYGNAPLIVAGIFGNAVPDERNHFTGPIIVNSGAKCAIGRKNCVGGSLNVGVVTNNGTVAWERRVAGTVTNTIIGGTFLMNSDLDPNGHPTFQNGLVTNIVALVYRGTLTLDRNSRWITRDSFRVGQQEAWSHVGVTATVNFKDGCDVMADNFAVANGNSYTYTNAATGATYNNVITGIVNQSGGIVRTKGHYGNNAAEYDGIRLGHYPVGHAFWNMSGGTLIVETYRLSLATDGYGTFNLTGGEVFADEVNLNGRPAGKGYGILNMTGGELNVGAAGIIKSATNDRYEIHLGGGTIRATATAGFSCPLAIDLTGSHGGVTFDTQSATATLSGAISGVGGFTKTGTGALILSGANTYTGSTCVLDGTIAFTQSYPGGDLELPASATGGTVSPLLTTPSFAFAEGRGVRVTGADTLDASTFGPMKTLVSSTTPITAVPTLALVSTDGTDFTEGYGIWHLVLMDGGKTLKFGPQRGTQMLIK